MVTKHDQSSIGIEIEKAVLLLTQKRALVQRLMNETCDEFNHAMRRLGVNTATAESIQKMN